MGIRMTVKAWIEQDGQCLLSRCQGAAGVYYALPGGGQEPFESIGQAIVRECAEETGLAVTPGAPLLIYEEIDQRGD